MSLARTLFGTVRGALLALLYDRPHEAFFYRDITRRLPRLSPGSIQRELKLLSSLGLIERRRRGNQVFYRAKIDNPVFSEIKEIVRKTAGLAYELTRVLVQPLERHIDVAFIYGSFARGAETAASDIDLMLIGTAPLDEVIAVTAELERSIGRAINPVVMSPREFRTKLSNDNHFVTALLAGKKIFLKGGEDELTKVGRVRVAED